MRKTLLIAFCGLLLATVACEQTRPAAEERAALRQAVTGYLDALAESYSSMSLEPLEGHASPNEIAAVRKLLRQLAGTGDRIEATLRGFEIEGLEVFREVNATARLVEVWDLVRYDVYTGREKGRTEGSLQSTILQLRLVDGRWVVIGRSILERPTPSPVAPAHDLAVPGAGGDVGR